MYSWQTSLIQIWEIQMCTTTSGFLPGFWRLILVIRLNWWSSLGAEPSPSGSIVTLFPFWYLIVQQTSLIIVFCRWLFLDFCYYIWHGMNICRSVEFLGHRLCICSVLVLMLSESYLLWSHAYPLVGQQGFTPSSTSWLCVVVLQHGFDFYISLNN